MAEQWYLRGEYFEQCNCDIGCGCIVNPYGRGQVVPNSPDGSCHVIIAFSIDEGRYGGVNLGGLNAVVVLNTPPGQPMAKGGGTAATYLDQRASAEQQAALTAIFTGRAGGPFGRFTSTIATHLGVKMAGVRYEKEGRRRTLRIEGISDIAVEMVPGHFDFNQPVSINNVNRYHPSHPLWQAVARASRYQDHGMEWDNTGKNSYVSPIDIKGP